jgi:drug/metabolite transporter superfamily protein YnfA
MNRLCYGPLRRGNNGARTRTLMRRWPVTILFLTLAAVLEVSGDFLMRVGLMRTGLGERRWGLLAGAVLLAGYGLLVNQPAWGFGRTLGLYIAVFFMVSQAVAFLAGGERPSPSLYLGGALIVLGGLVIYSGHP